MSHAKRNLLAMALTLMAVCAVPVSSASADRPLALRYQTHTRGDLASAANTLLTCPASVGATCTNAQAGTGGSRQNNNFNMEYVDVDSDATTFDSSSAALSLPAGATVTWAGLYWGADTSAGSGGVAAPAAPLAATALLDGPGASGYQPVTGIQYDGSTPAWPGRYQVVADVTDQVAAAGAGDYTLANVQAGTGTDRYAGWALVVAYRLAGDPIRNLSVFDGLVTIENIASTDLALDGFETPGAGITNARLGLVTYEGDYGITGDSLALNGTTVSDGVNASNNFFNSSISDGGTRVSAKSPDYVDQLGFDSDRVGVNGLIAAGATSANLHLTTNGDTYFVGAVTLSNDQISEPPANGGTPGASGTAEDGQTLTASNGSWSGTDPMDYDYQWQRCDAAGANCVDIPGATGSTYDPTPADVGQTVRVVVTATNEFGTDTATSAVTAVVAQQPPAAGATAPSISGAPVDGGTLTVDEGDWTGTGPVYTYQWQSCDAAGANCTDIPGATGSSYQPTTGDLDDTVRVVVTATNDAGSDSATSDATAAVIPGPPVASSDPGLTGTARDGEVLSADTGGWSGTGPFDFTYQWQRCDAAGANCTDIPGATGSTYELGEDDAGQTVRVVVTAGNDQGSQSSTSDASGVVAAVAPASTAGPSMSGSQQAGYTLTAGDGTWSGTGPFDITYQWQRCDAAGANCVDVPGATDSTYGLTSADVGSTIVVVVTATNPAGSDSMTSAPSAPIQAPAPATAQTPAGGSVPTPQGATTVADTTVDSSNPIAATSCQQLTGSQVLGFKVPTISFRIRVAPSGMITAARPLRAASPVSVMNEWKLNRSVRRVVYRLRGRRIATRRRAPYAVRIGPGLLSRAARQTLTVLVVPKRGKMRTARVQLNSKPCSELFSVVHRPSPLRSLLGLRVDSVSPLHGVVFRVPTRLLAKRGTRGVAGKLRVRFNGRKAINYRLSFPRRKTRATMLLAGAGRPQVRVSGGRITVSGLPAGTAGIRLRLRARPMLRTPRAKLRALVQTDGGSRRLAQGLGRRR